MQSPAAIVRDLGQRCELLAVSPGLAQAGLCRRRQGRGPIHPAGQRENMVDRPARGAISLTPGSPTFEPGREVIGVSASLEQSRVMLSFARAALKDREHEYRWLD